MKDRQRPAEKPFRSRTVRADPILLTTDEASKATVAACELLREIDAIDRDLASEIAALDERKRALEKAAGRKRSGRVKKARASARAIEAYLDAHPDDPERAQLFAELEKLRESIRERSFPLAVLKIDEKRFYGEVERLGLTEVFITVKRSPNKENLTSGKHAADAARLKSVKLGNRRALEIVPADSKLMLQKVVTDPRPSWKVVQKPEAKRNRTSE